ncbi:MAG: helix-turn-helix domain-containing protein [Candidatus Buchananbacteria bacterium]
MPSYRILTPEEVASIMKVSQKTVYRWISAGKLGASQVGYKTYRIFEQDLILFMKKNRVNKK